jgi:hypothetical protein
MSCAGLSPSIQCPDSVSFHSPDVVRHRHFESRLQPDILAVEAAVTDRWSNGPVEGQVNRLKTIKRPMYGRAGVELPRARLIPLSAEPILLQRD